MNYSFISPDAAGSAPGPGDEPVSLLLVDDDANNLLALESILDLPDYKLVRAQTSDQALLALMHTEFAAIVLDVQMPDISGIELAKLIKQRKRTQNVPILFLTAHYRESEHAMSAYDIGAVDYLTKPVHPAVLRSKVGVFVELFRKNRALALMNAELEAKNTALEREASERALRLQAEAGRAEAEAANAAKDRFLAILSHELRTPLSPVLHTVSLLEETPDLPPSLREDLEMIRRNVQLEARLIDDLLDLARIRNGKLVLHRRHVEIHELLRGAIAICQPAIASRTLEVHLQEEAAVQGIHADPARLQQVFWNLISNAVKFTPEGGRLHIKTWNCDTELLRIEISDSGAGIAPDKQALIFEVFEQVTSDSAGLGLGLSICKALTEFHGGRIGAISEGLGHGSTFWIELPVTAGAAPEAPAPRPVDPPRDGPPLRLLVVEDHLDTAVTLCRLLTRRGYAVEAADSCQLALKKAEQGSFDVLVTDIGLPDGNGTDLFLQIKAKPGFSDLRGVAISGFGTEEDLTRSLKAGFAEHLTKPVDFSSLLQSLRALDRPQGSNAPAD